MSSGSEAARLIDGHHRRTGRQPLPGGASINDICEIFGFFYPLPPCLHLELIYAQNSRNLHYYVRFSTTPSPLRCGHHIWTLPYTARLGDNDVENR